MKFKKALAALTLIISAAVISSCSKPAGQGGKASIIGKVHVTNYNATFTVVNGVYPGADVDVYIIYGDELSYGDRIKTGPDGVFEFKYLRVGKYKVYVYSKDKDAYLAGDPNPPNKAIIVNAEIKSKKETVDVGTIEIIN